MEFMLRLAVNLSKYGRDYLPANKSGIWKIIERIQEILEKNENVLVSGLWLGLSIHLLKDANLGSSRVKPYSGIPFHMDMRTHQNIFAGNSFLSFIFGTEGN